MPAADELAAKLPKRRLAELLAEACDRDSGLASLVEIELLGDQAQEIAAQLERRIDAVAGGLDFIDYSEAFGFGRELDELVAAIERNLLPLDPDLALAVCYHFLDTDAQVLQRADDSSGSIGESYCQAAELFVRAAAKAEDRDAVLDLALECIRSNDYGARDPIMDSARGFLSKQQFETLLGELRQDFLNTPKKEFASSSKFRYERAARIAGDPELLRRVLEETNDGELGGYDRIQIAQTLCAAKRWQEALDLAQDVEAKGSWADLIEDIQLNAYQGLGQLDKVAAIRRSAFRRYPSPARLQEWLDALPPRERETAESEAIAFAESDDCYPYAALSFLTEIGQIDRAADMVLRRIDRFSGRQWETLSRVARLFEKRRPLVATLLYRKLLEDILDNARSVAYPHAARYWRALAELAPRSHFSPTTEDEPAYKERLAELHKRKKAFWRALG